MKRWHRIILALGVAGLGLTVVAKIATQRRISAYTVDQATRDITSFTYEFLTLAVQDALTDLMPYADRADHDRAQETCLMLGLTDYAARPYCPSIVVLQSGSYGPFILGDAAGRIYLSDQVIAATGDDPGRLAAVIAHEMGHTAHLSDDTAYQYWSHAKRRIVAQTSGKARYMLRSEDFADGADQIRANPEGLLDYRFSPEEEAAAGAHASELLLDAGIPVDGFEEVRRRFVEVDGDGRFGEVHPPVSK